jgi:uncharacterized membrane protein
MLDGTPYQRVGTPGMKGAQMNTPRQTGKRYPSCATAAIAALAMALTAAVDRAMFGQCSYSHVEIAPSPCQFGGPPPLIPGGLNALGHITGYYRDCGDTTLWHAFFWSEDTGLITLPRPDGVTIMRAFDINDNRQIVGEASFTGIGYRGFMYDMNTGEFHFLETKHGAGWSWANSINRNGIVAGARSISKSGINPYNAVIWRPLEKGAPVEDLGLMNRQNSTAKALNESGSATGTLGPSNSLEAFLRVDKELYLLGYIPQGVSSNANGISHNESIAGNGLMDPDLGLPFSSQTALWRDGAWELLGLLPNCIGGGAVDLNDLLQLVGRCSIEPGVQRSFIWQHGIMVDLNHVMPDTIGQIAATAINNAGQIIARLDNTKGVLLTPQDVPFGDLNYDCKIDVHDLLIVFEQWGPVSRNQIATGVPSADLNGDGVVNVTDLLILFDHWNP